MEIAQEVSLHIKDLILRDTSILKNCPPSVNDATGINIYKLLRGNGAERILTLHHFTYQHGPWRRARHDKAHSVQISIPSSYQAKSVLQTALKMPRVQQTSENAARSNQKGEYCVSKIKIHVSTHLTLQTRPRKRAEQSREMVRCVERKEAQMEK
jgi:hypothetical protein